MGYDPCTQLGATGRRRCTPRPWDLPCLDDPCQHGTAHRGGASHQGSPRPVRVLSTARRGRRTLMKTLLIAMLLLCCGFDAIVAARAKKEDVSRIEVHRPPGKPMQLFDPTRQP